MKPSLDHYIGRPVIDVVQNEDGEAWEWGIRLEGGAIIRNHDKRRTLAPSNLNNLVLLLAIFSETETRIQFGRSNQNGPEVVEEIVLTPTQYAISDVTFTGVDEVFPQQPDPGEAALPVDPSPERVADGPITLEQMQAEADAVVEATEKLQDARVDAGEGE